VLYTIVRTLQNLLFLCCLKFIITWHINKKGKWGVFQRPIPDCSWNNSIINKTIQKLVLSLCSMLIFVHKQKSIDSHFKELVHIWNFKNVWCVRRISPSVQRFKYYIHEGFMQKTGVIVLVFRIIILLITLLLLSRHHLISWILWFHIIFLSTNNSLDLIFFIPVLHILYIPRQFYGIFSDHTLSKDRRMQFTGQQFCFKGILYFMRHWC
jgi:hypothetical protein